jgi:hypothetical protein
MNMRVDLSKVAGKNIEDLTKHGKLVMKHI